MSDDILDRIDAVVDEQMAGGEPRGGYDHGDPHYPRCHHCGRHWHGLPITERIAAMYAAGRFDEDYRSADDDSRVLCQGSEFIGPMPAQPPRTWAERIVAGLTGTRFGGLLNWPEPYLPALPNAPWVVIVDDPDSPPSLGEGWHTHTLGMIREDDL